MSNPRSASILVPNSPIVESTNLELRCKFLMIACGAALIQSLQFRILLLEYEDA